MNLPFPDEILTSARPVIASNGLVSRITDADTRRARRARRSGAGTGPASDGDGTGGAKPPGGRHDALTIQRVAVALAVAAIVPVVAQDSAHDQNRDKWQKVDEIFAAMGVKSGAVVADVGAGGGYFTARLARATGETGRVYAVDIGADVIKRLGDRVRAEGLKNVEIVHGAATDPKLPPVSLDAALIVNAYHEMNEHQAMLAALKAALKPNGRLVIVEPISGSRRTNARADQTRNHEIGIDFVRQDAREAGFVEVQAQDPFTKRANDHGDEEWILVLTPAAVQTGRPAEINDWKSPALRISPEDFKKLAADDVLILDVRDPDSYRRGHLPGAVLMTPEELSKPEAVSETVLREAAHRHLLQLTRRADERPCGASNAQKRCD